jgi:uncharacterized protein YukE
LITNPDTDTTETDARVQRAADYAAGLRDALSAVASQVAGAERHVAELKDRTTRGTEGERVSAAVKEIEQAAADFGHAVGRVRKALTAIATSEASETAAATSAFHRDFSQAIGAVIAEQRSYAAAVQSGACPIRRVAPK